MGTNSFLAEDKDDSFWPLRMKRHKKYLELLQEAAVQRSIVMKMGIEGDPVGLLKSEETLWV